MSLYFPREVDSRPVIEPDEKKVRFYCKAGNLETTKDFDLRKMVHDGKPDL